MLGSSHEQHCEKTGVGNFELRMSRPLHMYADCLDMCNSPLSFVDHVACQILTAKINAFQSAFEV